MSIHWHCDCGKSLKAPDAAAGKRAKCPSCGQINRVPEPEPQPIVEEGDAPTDEYALAEPPPEAKPQRTFRVTPPAAAPMAAAAPYAAEPEAVTPAPYYRRPVTVVETSSMVDGDDADDEQEHAGRSWRDFSYLVLLLAMIPLVTSTLSPDRGDVLEQSLAAHPEVREKYESMADTAGPSDVINLFPGHRLDGALLPRDSYVHWVFAAASATLFLTLLMFLFRPGNAKPKSLLLTGLFTGTVGILLLLAFQFVAIWTQGWWLRGRSIIVLLFYVVKFIGFSYSAAEDPNNGFAASFFGFTFGVGVCEEVCKAIPLIVMVHNLPERANWRTACLWGLASGVGFGVAEGIMYSGRYYNGIGTGEIYLVRFASCVALHATWAAAVAIPLFKLRHEVTKAEGWGGILFTTAVIAMPCIILHGLYDTLLKKEYNLYALGVALASFAYLVGLIEWSQMTRTPAAPAGRRYATA